MIGVFDMPFEEYRKAEGINQSALKRMSQSPAHLRAYLDEPQVDTDALIIGRLTHTAVFEPQLFLNCCHVRPEAYEKKGEWRNWNGNATECKDWIAAHQDKPVIRLETLARIQKMADSVRAHPQLKRALLDGKAEQSLFALDEDTGLQLKFRADWLSGNVLMDLKTTEDASMDAFAKSIATYGLDVQAAYGLDICRSLALAKDYCVFACVEKNPPYAVAVYQLDEESIEIGRRKYRYWLAQYKQCLERDEWPGYDPTIQLISLPEWKKRQLT